MLKLEDFRNIVLTEVKEHDLSSVEIKGGDSGMGMCPYQYGSDENNCRTISWDCGETFWTLNDPYMDDLP